MFWDAVRVGAGLVASTRTLRLEPVPVGEGCEIVVSGHLEAIWPDF